MYQYASLDNSFICLSWNCYKQIHSIWCVFVCSLNILFGPLGNPALGVMTAKPKLWYFPGRGRMESIRWLLAAAGVEVGSWPGKGRRAVGVRLEWAYSLFKIQDGASQPHWLFLFPAVFLCKRCRGDRGPWFKWGWEGRNQERCSGSFVGAGKILVGHKIKESKETT